MRQDIIKAFAPSIEARGHGGRSCLFHCSPPNVKYYAMLCIIPLLAFDFRLSPANSNIKSLYNYITYNRGTTFRALVCKDKAKQQNTNAISPTLLIDFSF
jgi:hypothetical protein